MFRDGADGMSSHLKESRTHLAIKPCVMCGCRWWNRYVSPASKISVPAALDAASSIAESAAQSTITMQARKGRASYLGERSIGHQDRATSVIFMMQMLALAAKSKELVMVNLVIVSHIAADWEKVSRKISPSDVNE